MSRKTAIPQRPHHVPVYNEDWEFLETYCSAKADTKLSPGVVIREMVHKRIMGLREQMNQEVDRAEGEAQSLQGVAT